MNTYITELASMIPKCHTMSRKLDKLTVLRMAVQHMKTIRGTVNSYTEGHYKLPFLTDQDMNNLITQVSGLLKWVDEIQWRSVRDLVVLGPVEAEGSNTRILNFFWIIDPFKLLSRYSSTYPWKKFDF